MSKPYIELANNNTGREEWLANRRKGIGGSDAAAILGLNPYKTPYVVWADKTGRLPEAEDNEAMRQGRDFEEYVAMRFTEKTGKKVRRQNHILQSLLYPFALANIDRDVIGENAGLECKTTSVLNLKRFKNGEYPEEYYCQCVHYMAVTGADIWYLAVLVLNQDFFVYPIKRDQEEIDALMRSEADFWEYVKADTPPPVDGFIATGKAINSVFPDAEGECELTASTTIQNYLALKETRNQLNFEIRKLEQQIKIELGECEVGHCGRYDVKWKKHKRTFVSMELLRKTYPKINLGKIMKAANYRRFSIIDQEENQ